MVSQKEKLCISVPGWLVPYGDAIRPCRDPETPSLPEKMMKIPSIALLGCCLLAAHAHGALTAGLVAYYDFEGNLNNNVIASGGAAFNGTASGGATTDGTARAGSGALNLNGTSQYVTIATNVNTTQSWSISAWFRSDVAPSGSARGFVFESFVNANTTSGYAMSYGIREGTPTGTNTNFQFFMDRTTGGDLQQDFQVADTSTAGVWHHILLTYTAGGSVTGYLDGVASYSQNVGASDSPIASDGLKIGSYRANGRLFDGSIDEVAVWNRDLTAQEAADLYNLGVAAVAIPEPSVALLGGLGVLALLRRRRC